MTNPNIKECLEENISKEGKQKFLVTVKTGKIVHVNLNILSHFLKERKERGMYISIDRPHKYIELLLKKKRVPQDKLCYVDIALRAAGAVGSRSFMSVGVFIWLKIMANTFEHIYLADSKTCERVNFYDLNFVVMDNASVLPAFSSMDNIREFFAEFGNIINDHKNLKAFIVTPKDLHPKMFETLKNFVDEVMDIPEEWVK